MNTSERPFTIHSDSKITLGPEARELARFNNMSETELARHLLEQHRLRRAGHIQPEDGS